MHTVWSKFLIELESSISIKNYAKRNLKVIISDTEKATDIHENGVLNCATIILERDEVSLFRPFLRGISQVVQCTHEKGTHMRIRSLQYRSLQYQLCGCLK